MVTRVRMRILLCEMRVRKGGVRRKTGMRMGRKGGGGKGSRTLV